MIRGQVFRVKALEGYGIYRRKVAFDSILGWVVEDTASSVSTAVSEEMAFGVIRLMKQVNTPAVRFPEVVEAELAWQAKEAAAVSSIYDYDYVDDYERFYGPVP